MSTKLNKVVCGLGIPSVAAVYMVPLGSAFAASTQNVALNLTVGSVIAIAVDSSSLSSTMTPNATNSEMKSNVTVSTNALTGYKLSLIDSDTANALASTNGSIPALAGTLTAGTAGWNISATKAVNNNTGSGATVGTVTGTNVAVPVSTGTALVVTNNANGNKTPLNETTTVQYNIATSKDQIAGTYTDTVVYTAS